MSTAIFGILGTPSLDLPAYLIGTTEGSCGRMPGCTARRDDGGAGDGVSYEDVADISSRE